MTTTGTTQPTATTQTSYWDVIIPIVASWVTNKYGNPNGDTPNQYPAILPPEVKRVADEAWRVYKAGGSPTQQDIRTLALQSAAQTPSAPTGFKFVSQELRDQPFAGGIKAPKYDISKLPSLGGGGGTATPNPAPTIAGGMRPGGSGRAGRRSQFNTDIGDDFLRPDMTPTGGAVMDRTPEYGTPADFKKVADAWNTFKTEHPNWAKLGATVAATAIGAMTGVGGAAIASILKNLILRERPAGPVPPSGNPPPVVPVGGGGATVKP